MKNEEIDQLFRERLHDTEVPPPAFVWPAVESKINQRKRRKALLFWFLGGGLALLALDNWYHKSHNASPDSLVETVLTPAVVSDPTVTSLPNSIQKLDEKRPIHDANTTAQKPNSIELISAFKTKNLPQFSSKSPDQPRMDAGLLQSKTWNSSPDFTLPISKASNLDSIQNTLHEAIVAGSPSNSIAIKQTSSLGLSPFLTMRPLQNTTLLASKKPIKFAGVDIPIIKKRKQHKACYDFSKVPFAWLLDAYLGPSLSRKSLRSGPDDRPYLNQRLNTESQDWSFNAGLRASLVFNRHFLLRTGLHYDQAIEKFEYIDPDFVKYNIVVSVNSAGVQKIDTISIEYGANYLKTYNRLGWLDIPIQLGAELRRGNGGISINSGISLNVLFWKRGAVLAPDGKAAYFTPGSGTYDLYQQRVGLSVLGSVQWFYHLSPRLRIFAEPYYRQILRSVTLPAHPVIQEYGIGGVRLGLTRIL